MIDVRDDGDIAQGHSCKPYGSGANAARFGRALSGILAAAQQEC
jgi:hypothetical protein